MMKRKHIRMMIMVGCAFLVIFGIYVNTYPPIFEIPGTYHEYYNTNLIGNARMEIILAIKRFCEMKKKKSWIKVWALILLLFVAVNSPLNYKFEKNENGYTVIGRRLYSPIMIIPSSYNFKNVTKIADGAFEWNNSTMLYIPNSIKEIGDGSFANNKNLLNVYIGDSVERIGIDAFAYCNDLKSVRMSPNIKNIDNLAFEECYKLKHLEFPEGLIRIGACAFTGCDFTKVIFPKTLSEIGEEAFKDCTTLSEVYFNNPETECFDNSFKHTPWSNSNS